MKSFIDEVNERMAENKIKSAQLKKTDSRKGEEFDPANPTYHLDADNIMHENIELIRYADSRLLKLNKDRQALANLQQTTSKQTEFDKYEIKILELEHKIRSQEENVEYFKTSLDHAINLKTNT